MDQSEARLHLQKMTAGAVQFAHVVAGINAGLFDAIARHGIAGVSAETLAQETGYFDDYVRVWCETAYAIQILEHAGDGRFRLADGFENLLTAGMPGSMVAMFRMTEIFVEERLEMPSFFRTGEVRTFQDHGERLSKVIADVSGGGVAQAVEHIYGRIPEVVEKLRAGSRLLEVGCGMGRLLPSLAKEFPAATFVGVDCDQYSVETGRSEVAKHGMDHCICFHQSGAESIDFHEEFDIVSLNLVMHELRADLRPEALRRMWKALKPGGVLISNDFYYPSQLEDFRKQEHQGAIGDQAAEVIWGNRHLSREQLADLFAECGFGASQFHVIQFPDQPFPRLTALAFK
jgi:SAM-dependent methyltransferase